MNETTRKKLLRYTVVTWCMYDLTAVAVNQIGDAYSSLELTTLRSSFRLWLEPLSFGMVLANAFVSFPAYLLTVEK